VTASGNSAGSASPEAARAAVLVSLATVDLVVIFNEDTPIRPRQPCKLP
jgi:bifunctional ADP-heptose synthase (sugar kinase/adenylyltransferase)